MTLIANRTLTTVRPDDRTLAVGLIKGWCPYWGMYSYATVTAKLTMLSLADRNMCLADMFKLFLSSPFQDDTTALTRCVVRCLNCGWL